MTLGLDILPAEVTPGDETMLSIFTILDRIGVHYIELPSHVAESQILTHLEMNRQKSLPNSRLTIMITMDPDRSYNENTFIYTQTRWTEFNTITIAADTSSYRKNKSCNKARLDENLRQIERIIKFFKRQGKEVIFDAEHFFQGYMIDPIFALESIQAAIRAGADWIVFVDTNGECLPRDVPHIINNAMLLMTKDTDTFRKIPCGIKAYNDCGLGLAITLAAVEAGVEMVKGCFYNQGQLNRSTDLSQVITNLQCKMGYKVLPEHYIANLTETSRSLGKLAETLNHTQNTHPINHKASCM